MPVILVPAASNTLHRCSSSFLTNGVVRNGVTAPPRVHGTRGQSTGYKIQGPMYLLLRPAAALRTPPLHRSCCTWTHQMRCICAPWQVRPSLPDPTAAPATVVLYVPSTSVHYLPAPSLEQDHEAINKASIIRALCVNIDILLPWQRVSLISRYSIDQESKYRPRAGVRCLVPVSQVVVHSHWLSLDATLHLSSTSVLIFSPSSRPNRTSSHPLSPNNSAAVLLLFTLSYPGRRSIPSGGPQ